MRAPELACETGAQRLPQSSSGTATHRRNEIATENIAVWIGRERRGRGRVRGRRDRRSRHEPAGESPAMKGARNHVAERTFRRRKPGTVPSDKPEQGSGSNLAGRRYRTLCKPPEHVMCPVCITRGPGRATRLLAKAIATAGNLAVTDGRLGAWTLRPAPRFTGVMATARKKGSCTKPVKPSQPRGERPRSKVGSGNAVRRLEGGRWAHSSSEPPVTRWDPATSRGTASAREPKRLRREHRRLPSGRTRAQPVDTPRTKRGRRG